MRDERGRASCVWCRAAMGVEWLGRQGGRRLCLKCGLFSALGRVPPYVPWSRVVAAGRAAASGRSRR
jgi:hypothetical protein